MEDKKGILYKGGCLCGKIIFEIFHVIQEKNFCKQGGTPIMSKKSTKPHTIQVRLGTFESDIMEHPTAHIFVGSKANGGSITDDLPQNGSNKPNS